MRRPNFADEVNILDIIALIFISGGAIVFQIMLSELPCPLCLLQRLGFLFMSFALILNMRYGVHSRYYSIAIISALYTGAVAMRQILIHIVPGTGSYGSPIFGLHLYTWVFILSFLFILSVCVMMIFGKYHLVTIKNKAFVRWITNICFYLILLITIVDLVLIYMECGFKVCPDNPITYQNPLIPQPSKQCDSITGEGC